MKRDCVKINKKIECRCLNKKVTNERNTTDIIVIKEKIDKRFIFHTNLVRVEC